MLWHPLRPIHSMLMKSRALRYHDCQNAPPFRDCLPKQKVISMNKSDPIINSNTILFKVLNRGSLDNKIFIFYDKKFEKSRIMVDKGLGHTWRIDAFQTILIEYN